MWKLREKTWNISAEYPIYEVNHVSTKLIPYKYHVTHVKRMKKKKLHEIYD